ncbi:MAG: hypothetical protein MRY49_00365 [Candidatus Pacebacteria bacterium]|nr:hypothetical protein [Candidatus Paceibacterota bacterium]
MHSLTKEENIPESAQVVVDELLNLPVQSGLSMNFSYNKSSRGSSENLATSIGNLLDDTDESVSKNIGFGGKEVRIGHFKVLHTREEIEFRHFWASDETTSAEEDPDDMPPAYYITYNEKTKKVETFGKYVWKTYWFFIFGLRIRKGHSIFRA